MAIFDHSPSSSLLAKRRLTTEQLRLLKLANMQLTTSFILASLSLATSVLAVDRTDGTLMLEHVTSGASETLWRTKVPAAVTSSTELFDQVPKACLWRAAEPMDGNPTAVNCERWNLEVKSVQYADEPVPRIICRCKDTQYTEAALYAAIGRVPPGMRQFIRYIHAFAGAGQGAGFSDSDILLRGDSPFLIAVSLLSKFPNIMAVI